MGFNAIFHKEVVTFHIISNILFNCQIVNPVDGRNSSKRIMNCNTFDKRIRDITGHVEMSAISACYLRLTTVRELTVSDVTLEAVDSLTSQQKVRTVLFVD